MVQGRNEIIWDGTGVLGRRASAGVYYYRLQADGQEMTKRMALLGARLP